MVIFTESIMNPKNVIFCVGTKTDLPGCMVKPRRLKSLTVSVTLSKQIFAVSPTRRNHTNISLIDILYILNV